VKDLTGPLMQQLGIENATHWILLTREAEAAGMVGSEEDGSKWLPELSQALAPIYARADLLKQYGQFGEQLLRMGYLDSQINQKASQLLPQIEAGLEEARPRAASRNQLSLTDFDLALSKLRGITRLEKEYATAARVSDRRAISQIKRRFDSVQVDAVEIPASKAEAGIAEPTDAQIAEQFIKYKDVKPGTGEFGFGYLQPQRVKLEWMVLDRDVIGAAIALDPVNVYKYWQQHRDTFKGEFTAEKANVEKAVRSNAVDQVLADADRYYKASDKGAVRNLPQDGAFRKLPADWDQTRPTMATLAKSVMDNLKAGSHIEIPAPAVESRTDSWVKIVTARELPGVGGAQFQIGTKQGSLSDLLAQLHELNPAGDLGLQAKVPFETPLHDGKGNVYYINVLDFRAESAPESIDEVKADVIKDLKLHAAYEKLKTEKDSYQLLAVTQGLEAVGKLFATPAPAPAAGAPAAEPTPLPVQKFLNVRRDQADRPLDSKEARDAIMGVADALGPQFAAAPSNADQRTLSVAIPSELSVAIVQILGQTPVTLEQLHTVTKPFFDNLAQGDLMKVATSSPFSFASMKERYGYKALTGDEGKSGKARPVSGPTELP
jgi:hypothetical protein